MIWMNLSNYPAKGFIFMELQDNVVLNDEQQSMKNVLHREKEAITGHLINYSPSLTSYFISVGRDRYSFGQYTCHYRQAFN